MWLGSVFCCVFSDFTWAFYIVYRTLFNPWLTVLDWHPVRIESREYGTAPFCLSLISSGAAAHYVSHIHFIRLLLRCPDHFYLRFSNVTSLLTMPGGAHPRILFFLTVPYHSKVSCSLHRSYLPSSLLFPSSGLVCGIGQTHVE